MEILFEKIYDLLYPSYMLSAFLSSTLVIKIIKNYHSKGKRKSLKRLAICFYRNKPSVVLVVSSLVGILFYMLFHTSNGYDYDYVVKLFTSYMFTVVFYDLIVKQFKRFLKNEEIKPEEPSDSNSAVDSNNSGESEQ